MEDETIRQKIAEEKEILRKIAMQSEPKNEPQPEADRPMQIPAVIGCDSGWIKCSDRLPDKRGWYLCYGSYLASSYDKSYENKISINFLVGQRDGFAVEKFHSRVTHWMPLPEPPNHGR